MKQSVIKLKEYSKWQKLKVKSKRNQNVRLKFAKQEGKLGKKLKENNLKKRNKVSHRLSLSEQRASSCSAV